MAVLPVHNSIVQVFGEHGRELITTETSFRLLRLLADSTSAFEALESQGAATHRIRSILHRSVFKVPQRKLLNREAHLS